MSLWKRESPTVIRMLIKQNQDLTAQIVRLSEIIASKTNQDNHPIQMAPVSTPWGPEDEWDELREQREAATAETVEHLEAKLSDAGFLNEEITFDN